LGNLKVASTPHVQLSEARAFGLLLPDVYEQFGQVPVQGITNIVRWRTSNCRIVAAMLAPAAFF